MNVIGISGSERDAAAALSVDGVIVAAAAEASFARVRAIGYRYTAGYPFAAIQACLSRAGISSAEIDRVVVVDDASDATGVFGEVADLESDRDVRTRPRDSISAAAADARQVGAVAPEEDLPVLVLSTGSSGQAAYFRRCRGELFVSAGGDRLQPLLRAVSRIADACGFDATSGYGDLERLASSSRGDDSAAVFDRAMVWDPARGVVVDDGEFERALDLVRGGASLGARDYSVNVRREQERQSVAWHFCSRVNALVVGAVSQVLAEAGCARVGLAGNLLGSRSLLAALTAAFGDAAVVAPVPEVVGRAIGAALERPSPVALKSLALGPDYSEPDIKEALENCRLDYLYEPDCHRLLARVSRMLSRGSVVGWFQGPMSFGPRSLGSRSILCDPSNRYARENMNRFLRRVAMDEPLPVAMTSDAAATCLQGASASTFHVTDACVRAEWVDRLRAGLSGRTLPVNIITEDQSPLMHQLLRLHHERADVPGLISTPLCGLNEPGACTPRDAVRSTFSSAIDALVIGRFLLMKDYWLLRSTADG